MPHSLRIYSLTLGTLLRFLGIGIGIALLVWYIHFQARNLLTGPTITLDDTGGTIHHTHSVELTGSASNIVKLTLNGREIHTDEAGVFREHLVLENGYTLMTLVAEDRFGRTTSLTREFVFIPEETSP